jgi:hypothetical protein
MDSCCSTLDVTWGGDGSDEILPDRDPKRILPEYSYRRKIQCEIDRRDGKGINPFCEAGGQCPEKDPGESVLLGILVPLYGIPPFWTVIIVVGKAGPPKGGTR